MDRDDLAARIASTCLLSGSFVLRSGAVSDRYFDKYRFEADPALLRAVAEGLAPLIPTGTEVLAGLELGGVPLATALSLLTGLPTAFVRKQAKPYGTARLAEGADVEGRRTVIVEDVITTGGQVVSSAGDLRERGASVTHVVCAIDRRDPGAADILGAAGLTVAALFTRADLEPGDGHH